MPRERVARLDKKQILEQAIASSQHELLLQTADKPKKVRVDLNTENHLLTFGINYQKEDKFTFSGSDQIVLDNNL